MFVDTAACREAGMKGARAEPLASASCAAAVEPLAPGLPSGTCCAQTSQSSEAAPGGSLLSGQPVWATYICMPRAALSNPCAATCPPPASLTCPQDGAGNLGGHVAERLQGPQVVAQQQAQRDGRVDLLVRGGD